MSTSEGIQSIMSVNRMMSTSTQPPKYPEMSPMVVPITMHRRLATMPMNSDTRAP